MDVAAQQPPPAPPPAPAPPPGPASSVARQIGWGLVAVAIIIAASSASALLAYLVFNRSVPRAPAPAEAVVVERPAARTQKAEAAQPPPLGPTLDLGEFVVNLRPGPGLAVRYARMSVVVEASERQAIAELERRQPQVRDAVIGLFRSKSFDELADKEGLERVRKELVETLSRLVAKGRVVNVYFVDLVVQ